MKKRGIAAVVTTALTLGAAIASGMPAQAAEFSGFAPRHVKNSSLTVSFSHPDLTHFGDPRNAATNRNAPSGMVRASFVPGNANNVVVNFPQNRFVHFPLGTRYFTPAAYEALRNTLVCSRIFTCREISPSH